MNTIKGNVKSKQNNSIYFSHTMHDWRRTYLLRHHEHFGYMTSRKSSNLTQVSKKEEK